MYVASPKMRTTCSRKDSNLQNHFAGAHNMILIRY